MIELYPNVPNYIRDLAKYWVDLALQEKNPFEAAKMIANFRNSCQDEEQKDFVDFYFQLRLEQLKNESNTNIS